MSAPSEFENRLKVSIGLMIWFLGIAITATFSLTMIYNRFLLVEEKMADILERVEYVNDRIDRKVGAVEERIAILEDRVDYLETYVYNAKNN